MCFPVHPTIALSTLWGCAIWLKSGSSKYGRPNQDWRSETTRSTWCVWQGCAMTLVMALSAMCGTLKLSQGNSLFVPTCVKGGGNHACHLFSSPCAHFLGLSSVCVRMHMWTLLGDAPFGYVLRNAICGWFFFLCFVFSFRSPLRFRILSRRTRCPVVTPYFFVVVRVCMSAVFLALTFWFKVCKVGVVTCETPPCGNGLFLDIHSPGERWTHEDGSKMMLAYLIDENELEYSQEDIRFIGDLIHSDRHEWVSIPTNSFLLFLCSFVVSCSFGPLVLILRC